MHKQRQCCLLLQQPLMNAGGEFVWQGQAVAVRQQQPGQHPASEWRCFVAPSLNDVGVRDTRVWSSASVCADAAGPQAPGCLTSPRGTPRAPRSGGWCGTSSAPLSGPAGLPCPQAHPAQHRLPEAALPLAARYHRAVTAAPG